MLHKLVLTLNVNIMYSLFFKVFMLSAEITRLRQTIQYIHYSYNEGIFPEGINIDILDFNQFPLVFRSCSSRWRFSVVFF